MQDDTTPGHTADVAVLVGEAEEQHELAVLEEADEEPERRAAHLEVLLVLPVRPAARHREMECMRFMM
jgi:hypothetical protein